MRSHPIMTAVAALWVSALSVGCEGYQDYNEFNTCPDPPGSCMGDGEPFYFPNGTACSPSLEYRCESRLCLDRQCVPSCIEDADCEVPGERCKLVQGGSRSFDIGQCVEPCTVDPDPTPGGTRQGTLCIDGLPTDCSELDEDEFCDRCGCSPSKYCVLEPVQGCADKLDVGAACTVAIQCSSGLCPAGVCVECVEGTDCASGACGAEGTCLGAAGESCMVPTECASGDCLAEGVCAGSSTPDAGTVEPGTPDAGTVEPDASAGDPDAGAAAA